MRSTVPPRKALPAPTPSEAAFEALLARFEHGDTPAVASAPAGVSAFLDTLYAKSGEYLARDPFATIGEASQFFTKVVGISFEGRQSSAAGLRAGDALALERQRENAYDPNAIAVTYGALQLGFLRREIAVKLAPKIDGGTQYRASVGSITGGGTKHFGVNIFVERMRAASAPITTERATLADAAVVQRALIGERDMRESQRMVLERLAAGRNTLAVLGTGRGKSFCFQYPAALGALAGGEKTVVLYPLRALANDQFDALQRRLGPLGIRVLRANGAIDDGERGVLMSALETGAWDIICATPEFVQYHLDRFTTSESRPTLVVVDEAHHLYESTHRPAYGTVGETIAALGNPLVLALTATASNDVFDHLRAKLRIDAWVIDPTVRENLSLVDARNTKDKATYIAEVLRAPGKAIVYCNSRSEATKLAEKLHRKVGEVAFYHAGVPTPERARVEELFRASEIRVVVATSAFGEGIDLPDVRHVFLYHLNFDFTEFNQQSGRAGRDGDAADIHLLFGESDRRINDFIINREAPTLHALRTIYKGMKAMAPEGTLHMSNVEIAAVLDNDTVDARTIAAALRIFADADLVTVAADDDGRAIVFHEVKEKRDLTRTARFQEGEAEREAFTKFAGIVLREDPELLRSIINRPIYPDGVPLAR
jgi:single-stranded-DNA-specific exonuclease